jgi:hypothetical protein
MGHAKVEIEILFAVSKVEAIKDAPEIVTAQIPYDAEVYWHSYEGRVMFAYAIGENLYTPRAKELARFRDIYNTGAKKALAELMKGEIVELIRVYR